ncbi:MAG: YidC/Oxa1 family membrane protein insertase [Armatimonadota bacterium]|nr:YidC/Oxa1 family membrane protein insertase [Armatimonadota bacterium]MDR5696746.1 YidC/Oxa1 family membrane protein insertase [Armatimonadota bacterium]
MFGWFNAIVSVINGALQFFYGITGSYGWAIIALTLAVKLALHPLTRKQLRSMKEMQKLGPHLRALQAKFRDDPQRLNREMMDLYRAHGVNPFGGCLPMLLQMPILFALFQVLNNAQNFVKPNGEALTAVPFGPWDLLVHPMTVLSNAGGAGVGAVVAYAAVPVLIGLSTYVQQRVSVTDPQQARMFIFMPFLIGYFSLNFAVGLSLYWFVSTLTYIAEYLLVVGLPKPPQAVPVEAARPAEAAGSPGRSRRRRNRVKAARTGGASSQS